MIRKLILPAIAVLLLAGCATGYSYRNAPGDYYYGQPGTVYRDYYGYPSYYGGYSSPYHLRGYYGYGYYGYPYGYGRYPYRHHGGYPHSPRPGTGDGGSDRTPDRPTPPWRDLDRVGELRGQPTVPRAGELRTRPVQPAMPQVQRPATQVQRPMSRSRAEAGGSRMSEMIRRAQPNRDTVRSSEE